MNCTGLEVRLTEILGCRSDGNKCYSVSSAATMLFHGLPGGEMHGVMEEMERRGKSDSATISSAIDMGETETNMPSISGDRVALCAGCGGKISDRYYLLAVDKQWHMRCLKCCECKLNLESELTCFSKDGSIYCKEDYYSAVKETKESERHLIILITASDRYVIASHQIYFVFFDSALSCNENDGDPMDRDSQYSSSQKTKRMRTSFKHHQLRTMKSYFAINHNPDAKDLKQLAQKTGLTKRVLQVWFQNARAKFRRNLLRQENTGVDKTLDGSTLPGGTPSGPASEISNASMSPSSTPTTLTDLTNPTMPTVTSVLTSVPGNLDIHECRSPSQSTLTSLF
ncbi:LIM/homeobox protein Lhx2b [Sinocyclocheilus anshuiensis]|uniref:LIM/homeobox protein Lhx2b n=1 Tax=Sinocyclocheilus anshuiensis TaxID=1608454 RepID=UPI0007B83907|nr:PREDICTED: LIM/homeobox protein Lhx2-like [Sinocyclocheilus anshuiensis]